MKQKFKGKTLYTKTVTDNILRVYDAATDKSDWYQDANEWAKDIAYKYLYRPLPSPKGQNDIYPPLQPYYNKVCGIIAALSPLKSWQENKNITITFLRDGKGKHTKVFKQKAQDILDSDGDVDTIASILNGNKITSFFLNILNPQTIQAVTVDRHAISVALNNSVTGDYSMTVNQYEFFQNCYRIAAQKRGIRPLQMQAVTWVQWRVAKKITTDLSDVPF